MAISNTLLTSAVADIFVCPASQEHAVTCMIFCNTTGTDTNLDVYAIPSGQTAGVNRQIMKTLSIPAGETFTFDTEKLVLAAGDKIAASTTVNNAITATVSSMRVS